jgi:DNA-binding transcriptional LysR family regulator
MTCLVAEGRHVAAMPLSVARLLARHGMLSVLPVRMRAGPEAYGTIVSRRRPLSAAGVRLVEALHRLADGGDSPQLESGIQTP